MTAPVCGVCHGTLSDWRAGLTVTHNLTRINDGTHTDCTQCHVQPNAPYGWAAHHDALSGAPAENRVEINTNADMNYDSAAGTCNSACHDNLAPYNTIGTSTLYSRSRV